MNTRRQTPLGPILESVRNQWDLVFEVLISLEFFQWGYLQGGLVDLVFDGVEGFMWNVAVFLFSMRRASLVMAVLGAADSSSFCLSASCVSAKRMSSATA